MSNKLDLPQWYTLCNESTPDLARFGGSWLANLNAGQAERTMEVELNYSAEDAGASWVKGAFYATGVTDNNTGPLPYGPGVNLVVFGVTCDDVSSNSASFSFLGDDEGPIPNGTIDLSWNGYAPGAWTKDLVYQFYVCGRPALSHSSFKVRCSYHGVDDIGPGYDYVQLDPVEGGRSMRIILAYKRDLLPTSNWRVGRIYTANVSRETPKI